MEQCSFNGNSATSGIGGALGVAETGEARVTGSILYRDWPGEVAGRNVTISYSNISGGYSGESNLDEDPRYRVFRGYGLGLSPGSPCIDAGEATLSDGIQWPSFYRNGQRADMGAYGGPLGEAWLPDEPD